MFLYEEGEEGDDVLQMLDGAAIEGIKAAAQRSKFLVNAIRSQGDDVDEQENRGRPTVAASDDACVCGDLTSTSNLE